MGQQPTASSSGGRRPAGSPPSAQAARRRTTERVAPLESRGTQLPGWFWGALGCLSVLAAGFSILFFTMKPSAVPAPTLAAEPAAPAAPSAQAVTAAPAAPAAPAAAAAAAAPARPVGIQVEQLAPSPAPMAGQLPTAVKKPKPRQVKIARWPTTPESAVASDTADDSSDDEREEELLKSPKRAKPRPSVSAEEKGEETE